MQNNDAEQSNTEREISSRRFTRIKRWPKDFWEMVSAGDEIAYWKVAEEYAPWPDYTIELTEGDFRRLQEYRQIRKEFEQIDRLKPFDRLMKLGGFEDVQLIQILRELVEIDESKIRNILDKDIWNRTHKAHYQQYSRLLGYEKEFLAWKKAAKTILNSSLSWDHAKDVLIENLEALNALAKGTTKFDINSNIPLNYRKFCRPKIEKLYEMLYPRNIHDEVSQTRIFSLIAALLNVYCPPILPADREHDLWAQGKPVWTADKVKKVIDYVPVAEK